MKTVIITGAAGGMGRATAEKFLIEGYQVFGLDIREPEGLSGIRYIRTDLTDMESVTNAYNTVRAETDHADALIHMAGIYDLNSLVEMSEEDFVRIFNINLFSIFRVNRQFLPLIMNGGRVIITSSELAPLDPLPFTGIYGITKTAVEKYAFSLRMELQLLDIPVSIIRPGAVDTGLLDDSTRCLDEFCSNTELYSCNAGRFKSITDSVESRNIPPEKIAEIAYKAANAKNPRFVYKINRNPMLLMLNALPDRMQTRILKKVLT